MSEFNPSEYTIVIKYVRDDDGAYYEGRVMELPDVCVYHESHTEAYDSLIAIISDLKLIDDNRGVAFPEPFNFNSEYSGRITLRLPKNMHRQVDFMAIAEGISINQYIVNAVSQYNSIKKFQDALNTSVLDFGTKVLRFAVSQSTESLTKVMMIPQSVTWDSRSGARAEHSHVDAPGYFVSGASSTSGITK